MKLYLFLPFFLLVASLSAVAFAEMGSTSVEVEGVSHEINFNVEGVTFLGVEPDLEGFELIFQVEVTETGGILEITLPRDLLDSKFEGEDDEFFVIADGELVEFSETSSTETTRTLLIELLIGTEEVEVIGSQIGSMVLGGETIEEIEEVIAQEITLEETVEIAEQPIAEEEIVEVSEMEEPAMEEPEMEVPPTTQVSLGAGLERPQVMELVMSTASAVGIVIGIAMVLWVVARKRPKKSSL